VIKSGFLFDRIITYSVPMDRLRLFLALAVLSSGCARLAGQSSADATFHHLADEGLHPILGGTGDPGAPAAQLLEALGIRPAPEGNRQVSQNVQQHLAEIRSAFFGNS
jgi:hypothetical protein